MPTSDLKALGEGQTRYAYDEPNADLLESFPNPMPRGPAATCSINIVVTEFTSLCPITGQPDFAKIIIDYTPFELCVESKALKLYLGSYRNHGEFHEACVGRITTDLIQLLDPLVLHVKGEFTPRGGIPFWPEIHYERVEVL